MKDTAMVPRSATDMERFNLDLQSLIQSAIEKGAGIETLERLVALAKDVQAQRSRSAWYSAIAEFQRLCPMPKKDRTAQAGVYSFKYTTLEEWMTTILPVMGPLGLSVSWKKGEEVTGAVSYSCVISHSMGHSEESGQVSMPILPGLADGRGANAAQRVGMAHSYAMRYSLRAIVGLAPIDVDEDGPIDDKAPTVMMPSRESAAPARRQVLETAGQKWVGLISQVKESKGETNGRKWTYCVIVGGDHTEFGTFDTKVADFARQAGMSEVEIAWEPTKKGGKKVLSINPAETREPGDEDPGA